MKYSDEENDVGNEIDININQNEYMITQKNNKKNVNMMDLYKETMEWMTQFQEEGHIEEEKKIQKNMPWIEKFRPQLLSDVLAHEEIINTLNEFIKKKQVPHLLFYGPPGTGKTSTAMACARELHGDNYPLMVLEINASEERGIEVVRNKIKDFIITKGVFLKKNSPLFKVVILDEADAMTTDAQAMLRSVIERHTENVRFWLICNYVKKINPAIQSRCTPFKFSPLNIKYISSKLLEIGKQTDINITKDGIEEIVKISRGDMRKIINIFQSTSMIYNEVNKNTVAKCVGYPTNEDIDKILKSLKEDDINTCDKYVSDIITKNGYGLSDIITELVDIMTNKFIKKNESIKAKEYCDLIKNMKNIDMNLAQCQNESIQIGGIVAAFRLIYHLK